MFKTTSILLSLLICSTIAKAQKISPTDLLQIYKYWNMEGSDYGNSTVTYIHSIDENWKIRVPPQKDDHSLSLLFGYLKNNSWVHDKECNIMLSFDRSQSYSKQILYIFNDPETWTNYNDQMVSMNAISIATHVANGGKTSYYQVMDIEINLTEFPPGINGPDKTYQVQIYHNRIQ